MGVLDHSSEKSPVEDGNLHLVSLKHLLVVRVLESKDPCWSPPLGRIQPWRGNPSPSPIWGQADKLNNLVRDMPSAYTERPTCGSCEHIFAEF